MMLKYEVTYESDEFLLVIMKNPFDKNGISISHREDISPEINRVCFRAMKKFVELELKKITADETILSDPEKQGEIYVLLSKLHHLNDYSELLTKLQSFKELFGNIKHFKNVLNYLEERFKP